MEETKVKQTKKGTLKKSAINKKIIEQEKREQTQDLCNRYLEAFIEKYLKGESTNNLSCRLLEDKKGKYLTIFKKLKVMYQVKI